MAENDTLSGNGVQLNATVKEQCAVVPEYKIEPERHDVLEVVEERPGHFDDLVRVRYTGVYVHRPGSGGPNGTMDHWNFQVVDGKIHRPETWQDVPDRVTDVARDALENSRKS